MRSGPSLCLLSVALLATSCTEGFEESEVAPIPSANFAPSSGDVPVPSDLLFSGSLDVTLNAPVADASDFTDPLVQLNALDGWSTNAPFTIAFSEAIDIASVVPGSSIRIFQVATAATALMPVGAPVTGVVAELAASDFSVALAAEDATGATIRVSPETVLMPATAYMVVLTNAITDPEGRGLVRAGEFALASAPTPYPVDHPFAGLQGLVLAEAAAAASQGIDPESIVLSYTFTTQGIGEVLGTLQQVSQGLEGAVIAGLCAQLPSGCAGADQNPDPLNAVTFVGDTVSPGTTATLAPGFGFATIYTGGLTLPYYLTAASNPTATSSSNDPTPLSEFWRARYEFFPGDTERNLTRFNPLPAATGQEEIPVIIGQPSGAFPATGRPVVIFQHGITGDRAQLLLVADALALFDIACIGIDLPLHGLSETPVNPLAAPLFDGYEDGTRRERTFGLDLVDNATGAPGPDGVIDPSGQHYINLTSLLTGRDNLRQASADLFNLLSVLGSVDILTNISGAPGADGNPDFDVTRIGFLGHSLGGIVGGTFLAMQDGVDSAVLGMAGGGIVELLVASESFGPIVLGGLSAAGVEFGTPEFEQFAFLGQTVIDRGDPLNYAALLGASGLPLHAFEIVGGGAGGGLPDQTVPNSSVRAPLAGSTPYYAALGLTQVDATANDAAGLQTLTRFTEGTHGSVVLPSLNAAENAAFIEIQAEFASFFNSQGQTLVVTDTSVIQTAP